MGKKNGRDAGREGKKKSNGTRESRERVRSRIINGGFGNERSGGRGRGLRPRTRVRTPRFG